MKAEQQPQKRMLSVNGTNLMVEVTGAGAETVVFSPALFANQEMFDPLVAELGGDHRCVRYDHRGQGESGFGARQPSRRLLGVQGLYDDGVALLDQLGVEACHWVGASIGGFVGIRLAVRHPERVRSLVLIGPSTRRPSRVDLLPIDVMGLALRASSAMGQLGSAVRRRITEQVMINWFSAAFLTDPARTDEREAWRQRFAAQLVPEGVPMHRAVCGHPGNPAGLLAQVRAPTLVVVGEDERLVPGDAAEASQAIPGARLVSIPDAGHVVLIEQPEVGTAVIAEFLRTVEAAHRSAKAQGVS